MCISIATEGPVKVPRPNLLDLLGRAKWDAWKKRESLNKPQAQQAYVETLLGILKGFSDKPEAVQLINELRNFGSSDADEQTGESHYFEPSSTYTRSHAESVMTFHRRLRIYHFLTTINVAAKHVTAHLPFSSPFQCRTKQSTRRCHPQTPSCSTIIRPSDRTYDYDVPRD